MKAKIIVGLGVGAQHIQTVSNGKERPVALGSDEASWARNRRAVTVTVQYRAEPPTTFVIPAKAGTQRVSSRLDPQTGFAPSRECRGFF